MKEIRIKAPAKINLYLAVFGKRKDGFHNIETVMQTVDFFDEIELKERPGGIRIFSSHPQIPKGKSNLAYQAARLFLERTGLKKGIFINLKKNIPVGAGLGGGSSDAAAVLRGMDKLWNLKLSKKKLIRWAKELGSDVPFFIKGNTAWVRGRGEKVKVLRGRRSFCFLLFFPGRALSTAKVYHSFTQDKEFGKRKHIGRLRKLTGTLKGGNLKQLKTSLYNGLEKTVFRIRPDILAYYRNLTQAGLAPVKLCGSGSALFAPVGNVRQAEYFINKLNLRKEARIVKSFFEP